ncbi:MULTISPECIES: hypothetical protein [unclassified Mycobacterium]|uniref:hypothetical protein n=1 Tax=unclassified Mycobacterium TaxID=2642494 RepID=UPI0029C728E9|nr:MULTISPECIES: hypothetical protein [unclassified Mycobacterium]
MTSAIAARRAAERWFLDHGLPSVVTRRARLRAAWSRSAPALTGFAVVTGCALTIFLLTGHTRVDIDGEPSAVEWVVLGIVALALPLAAISGWAVARMTTNRAQAITSTISVAFCAGAAAISDGGFGLLATAAVVASTLALTSSGVGSIIGWAIRLTLSQFAAAGALLIRALPVVLLSVLVFFNTYVWIMSATISAPRLWLALGLLIVIAAVFVISGTFEKASPLLQSATASARHAERLADTPFEHMSDPDEPDPLTKGEWLNVIFVLAATQLAQILMVAIVTASLFFVLGLILLSPELLAAWTRNGSSDGTLFGMTLPVPQALIHITLFLAALTFMYICARAVGDGEYRQRFLDPLIDDLKLTLLARNRYRNNPVSPGVNPP